MIKTRITLFFFILLHFSSFSQSILKGTVKDSLGNPLPYANILAEPEDPLEAIKFAITGEQGRYQMELKNIPYILTASFLGYEAVSFEVHPTRTIVRDIVLKPQTEGLRPVVIELPIVVKEDTIVYNVERLMTGEERKLKDILKKLPGVEVDRDGSVTVQGKKVTTLLVENREFFGGSSKLAVENIPADAVHQVEVLENYNEVAFLKNLQDSDEMAMNIKLKENKKDFMFGDVEAGKGDQDFYKAHSNLFYYSPTTTLNVIGNLNNIADQVFTYQQYFDFKGGMNEVFTKGITNFDSPDDDFLQFMERDNVIKSERKFGALNFSQEVNNKLNISGFGIFSDTKETTFTQSINEYKAFTETKDASSGTDKGIAIGNIKVGYLPNLTDQWFFKTQFKKADNSYNNRINSIIDTTNNTFLTQEEIVENYFNQVLEWHRKSSRKHTFSLVANYTYNQRSPRTIWNTSDPMLQGLIPIIDEPTYRFVQKKVVEKKQADAIFKHYWVIDRENHIYSTIGNTFLHQHFFTQNLQELNNGVTNNFDDEFGNDLIFNLNDLFLGLHYKFQLGKLTFNQGVFLHHYQWNLDQQSDISKKKTLVLPSFSAELKFSRIRELKLDYKIRSFFSDASQLSNKFYLGSYNSVFRGNENLGNELSHNFKLRYSKFSTYRGTRFYATANFIQQIRGIKEEVTYEKTNRSVMPIMLDNPERSWSFYGNLRKKISDINFSLGLNYNASEFNQKVNGVLETNKTAHFSYDIAGQTLFDNFPIIEIGFKQSYGQYNLSGNTSEFLITEPFLNVDYDFLKGFIASLDYSSYSYRNKTLNLQNRYQLANASLFYKKESCPWSFKLEVQNLFDVKFKNQSSFSSYVISDSRTFILPRIVMLSIGYQL